MTGLAKSNFAYPLFKHIFASLFLLCLTNCTKDRHQETTTLKLAIANEIKNFDIRTSADRSLWPITKLLTQSLVQTNENGELSPSLASSWRIMNSKSIRFILSKSSRFHSGRQVEVEDVIYSFKDAQRPHSPISSLLQSVESYTKESKNSLLITLKSAEALPFLFNVVTVVRILPRDYAKNEALFAKHPIGSGPYKFVKSFNRVLFLERNPFYSPAPTIEKLEFYTISSPTTRLMALAAGEIDLLTNSFPLSHIEEIASKYSLQLDRQAGRRLHYLGLNLNNESLKKRELRHRLYYSIDRQALINDKLGRNVRIADSFLPATDKFYHHFRNPALPRKAPIKISKPLRFIGINSPEQRSLMLALQDYWRKSEIETEIISRDFASFMDEYRRGNFDIALASFSAKPDPDFLYSYFHSSQLPPERNRFYYQNPELDLLLESARRATEQKTRQKLYTKAQEILMTDLPVLPLWYSDNVALFGENKQKLLELENNRIVLEELMY